MTTTTQTITPEEFFKDRKVTKKWVNTCLGQIMTAKGARLWWTLEMAKLGDRNPTDVWNDDKAGDREKIVRIAESYLSTSFS